MNRRTFFRNLALSVVAVPVVARSLFANSEWRLPAPQEYHGEIKWHRVDKWRAATLNECQSAQQAPWFDGRQWRIYDPETRTWWVPDARPLRFSK